VSEETSLTKIRLLEIAGWAQVAPSATMSGRCQIESGGEIREAAIKELSVYRTPMLAGRAAITEDSTATAMNVVGVEESLSDSSRSSVY
jgi:hypothetical protein